MTALRHPRTSSLIELLAARAASDLLYGFARDGALDYLRTPRTAPTVARKFGWDTPATRIALEYLARTTQVVASDGGRYAISTSVRDLDAAQALLEKFVGAYGPVTRDATARLRDPRRAGAHVDRTALARAYARDRESPVIVKLLHDLRPECMLDIGCGRGTLLASVCAGRSIRGIGIDADATMCNEARRTVRARGLARSVSIRQARLRDIPSALSPRLRDRVSLIHIASALNELCGSADGISNAIARLGRWFPGRMLVVVDYLSVLSTPRTTAGMYTCLTDVVQVLSGQGLPPGNHRGWRDLYRRGGGTLVGAYEGDTHGLRWFIHLVQLETSR